MRYAVQLADIAEQLHEVTDAIREEVLLYSIYDIGYTDNGGLANSRLRKLMAVSVAIYLTVSAVRVSEEMDEDTEDIICTQIEHALNDMFIRTTDGTPYFVYPFREYMDDHGITAQGLAEELYTIIHDSFLSTEAFDSEAYQEIVSFFMDIPENIDLYDFTLATQFRYRLGIDSTGLVRGLMVIVR